MTIAFAEPLCEALNGWFGEILGFRRSGVQGSANAQGEWDLVYSAPDIRPLQTLPAV